MSGIQVKLAAVMPCEDSKADGLPTRGSPEETPFPRRASDPGTGATSTQLRPPATSPPGARRVSAAEVAAAIAIGNDDDEDGGSPFLPIFDGRAGESSVLLRESVRHLAELQEKAQKRRRLLPFATFLMLIYALAASHSGEGGHETVSYFVEAFCLLLAGTLTALVLFEGRRALFVRLVATVLLWLLCFLLSISDPARRHQVLTGEQDPEAACPEIVSAMNLAILLCFVATTDFFPAWWFAFFSQVLCLQHLLLTTIDLPDGCFEGGTFGLSTPHFGMPRALYSGLQLHALVGLIAIFAWRCSSEQPVVKLADDLAQQTQALFRRTPSKIAGQDDFTVRTGLEVAIDDMLTQELAALRLLDRLRQEAPTTSGSTAYISTVCSLVQFIFHISGKLRTHSIALQAIGHRSLNRPIRDSVRSAPGDVQRQGIQGFIEQSFMASQISSDGSDEEPTEFGPLTDLGSVAGQISGTVRQLSSSDFEPCLSTPRLPQQVVFRDSTRSAPPVAPSPMLQELLDLCERRPEGRLGEWNFNTLQANSDLNGHILQYVGFQFLQRFPMLKAEVLAVFLKALEEGYVKENPYHTHVHAADVCNSIFFMTNAVGFWGSSHFTDNRRIAILLAALGHDVGHFGRNNHFLAVTKHALATTYNDRSVLENFHTATLFRLLDSARGPEGTDLLAELSYDSYSKTRQAIVTWILATDTQSHLEALGEFRLKLTAMEEQVVSKADQSAKAPAFDPMNNPKDQVEVLSVFFRAADIGHSAKSWDLHQGWSERVCQEFHAQGDEEKQLGIPISPLCDRAGFVMCKSQMGFLQFVCIPTWTSLAKFEHLLQAQMAPPPEPAEADFKPEQSSKRQSFQALTSISSMRGTPTGGGGIVALISSMKSNRPSVVHGSDSGTGSKSRRIAKYCLAQCEANLEEWKAQADTRVEGVAACPTNAPPTPAETMTTVAPSSMPTMVEGRGGGGEEPKEGAGAEEAVGEAHLPNSMPPSAEKSPTLDTRDESPQSVQTRAPATGATMPEPQATETLASIEMPVSSTASAEAEVAKESTKEATREALAESMSTAVPTSEQPSPSQIPTPPRNSLVLPPLPGNVPLPSSSRGSGGLAFGTGTGNAAGTGPGTGLGLTLHPGPLVDEEKSAGSEAAASAVPCDG